MAYRFAEGWPAISHNAEDILKLRGEKNLGLDLEWDIKNGELTTLGIGNDKWGVSTTFQQAVPYLKWLLHGDPSCADCANRWSAALESDGPSFEVCPQHLITWHGHNLIGADLMVLEKLGIQIPLKHTEDSIIRHWLTNLHLCKTTKKEADADDHEEKKGRGFMNLWTMASLYTNFRNWKYCRDGVRPGAWREAVQCEGPCPVHQPFDYNGVDTIAPIVANPQMKRIMQLRGVEKLYPMHRELAYVLAKMQEAGVKVDVPYVNELRVKFAEEKQELVASLPFNPESGKQALAYFHAKGIHLDNWQEGTLREASEELDENDAAPEVQFLFNALEYKELGDGADRWFAPKVWVTHNAQGKKLDIPHWEGFVDDNGFLHPSLGYFTSSARLMCVGPNLQNVAKRRISRRTCVCEHLRAAHDQGACTQCSCLQFVGEPIGKAIRRAIIAPEGYYIVRADYSNAENRNFLYLADYEPPTTDLHQWMVGNLGLKEDDEFSIRLGGAREASKSVTHAADYGEGLQLKWPHELKIGRCKDEIAAGARLVFPNWTFRGRIVTFTGINLANRIWGEASYENRHKALMFAEQYIGDGKALASDFGAWPVGPYPNIRTLQARIWKQCETEKMVRPPHGYALLSFGQDEDRMKQAAAVWGSQPVAHFTKLALLKLWNDPDGGSGRVQYPVLQVHDEILTYCRKERSPFDACVHLAKRMVFETPEMPGFKIPADCSYGDNWRDQTKVKYAELQEAL